VEVTVYLAGLDDEAFDAFVGLGGTAPAEDVVVEAA
jgi:hypothetical protein